jgi:DNA repair protein RadC
MDFVKCVGEIKISYQRNPSAAEDSLLGFEITSSRDAERGFRALFDTEQIEYRETAWALYLDRANKVLAWSCISQGGAAGTVIDARLVYQPALLCHASACILAHNHPSGNLKASTADLEVTRKMVAAGKALDIALLDHLILTNKSYTSLADEGAMPYATWESLI